jgi:Tfp pilus assembly protein PilF
MMDRLRNVPRQSWILLLLSVGTLAVYVPVRDHEFLLYDDYGYIVRNFYLQPGVTWENIVWAFTSGYAANWHPLTWISHMVDYQLFGLNPAGHHLHNVLLHVLNSIVLFLVVWKMTGAEWPSAFVAAMFALHPLHVESVAWASERKDLLSGLFWILTMGAYVRYTRSPSMNRYLLVLVLFVLGLLSKPMVVTLPFVLLLLDYWPLKRLGGGNSVPGLSFSSALLEKVPLMLLSFGSSIITYHVQQAAGAMASTDRLPLVLRLENAIVSLVRYLGKTFWPSDLAVFYPHPGMALSVSTVLLSGVILGTVTMFTWLWRKRSPYLFVGWFWFLGTLVPVLGIVQVGAQAMADRYMYLPLIGLALMIGWFGAEMVAHSLRRIVGVAAVLGLVALLIVSRVQVGYWQNTETLFQHAAKTTERNWVAHYNLGLTYAEGNRYEEALHHYVKTIEYAPRFVPVYYELGNVLLHLGRDEDAISYLRRSIALDSTYAKAFVDLGVALCRVGRPDEALQYFEQAYRLNRWYGEPNQLVGLTLVQRGQYEQALQYLQRALEKSPQDSLLQADVRRIRQLMIKR